jgi:hypothetical protein
MHYHGRVTVIIPICNRQQLPDKTLLSFIFNLSMPEVIVGNPECAF